MKKIMVLPVLMIALWSCKNNNSGMKTNSYDSLETNPHAVPSHVDTTTHEDGLHNQSSIPSDTNTTKERSRDSLIH